VAGTGRAFAGTDPPTSSALVACVQGRREPNVSDTDALSRFPGRYRFFVGENDLLWIRALSAAAEQLKPGSLVMYPGLNHLECFQRSDLLAADLCAFFDNGV
jgi:hypothetical protein